MIDGAPSRTSLPPQPAAGGATPVATVGVLGGGQLGRLLALAGLRLGVGLRFLDPDPAAPAGAVAPLSIAGWDDETALARLARGCDVVTFEVETVPAAALRCVAGLGVPVLPGLRSLTVAQDRVEEKRLFAQLGIPAPRWAPVDGPACLPAAIAAVGLPALLKRRCGGYDGRGQRLVSSAAEAASSLAELGASAAAPCILEQLVAFDRELSVTVVRGADGDLVVYPLGENVHHDGVLRLTRAPAPADPWLIATAQAHAVAVAEALGHVGALTLELFERDGRLLAVEIAPRVHNTAHWTIEGAVTSQFENHLRAVLGLPLGSPEPRGAAALVNLLGTPPPLGDLLALDGAAVHLYGKEPRPGRKVGHITLVDADHDHRRLEHRLARVLTLIERSSNAIPHHAVR